MLEPFIISLIQLAFGKLIKSHPALASFPNKAIPVVNFILAVLIKLSEPVLANAAGIGGLLRGVQGVLLPALIQTLLTTGIHSSAKNVWQNVKSQAIKQVGTIV